MSFSTNDFLAADSGCHAEESELYRFLAYLNSDNILSKMSVSHHDVRMAVTGARGLPRLQNHTAQEYFLDSYAKHYLSAAFRLVPDVSDEGRWRAYGMRYPQLAWEAMLLTTAMDRYVLLAQTGYDALAAERLLLTVLPASCVANCWYQVNKYGDRPNYFHELQPERDDEISVTILPASLYYDTYFRHYQPKIFLIPNAWGHRRTVEVYHSRDISMSGDYVLWRGAPCHWHYPTTRGLIAISTRPQTGSLIAYVRTLAADEQRLDLQLIFANAYGSEIPSMRVNGEFLPWIDLRPTDPVLPFYVGTFVQKFDESLPPWGSTIINGHPVRTFHLVNVDALPDRVWNITPVEWQGAPHVWFGDGRLTFDSDVCYTSMVGCLGYPSNIRVLPPMPTRRSYITGPSAWTLRVEDTDRQGGYITDEMQEFNDALETLLVYLPTSVEAIEPNVGVRGRGSTLMSGILKLFPRMISMTDHPLPGRLPGFCTRFQETDSLEGKLRDWIRESYQEAWLLGGNTHKMTRERRFATLYFCNPTNYISRLDPQFALLENELLHAEPTPRVCLLDQQADGFRLVHNQDRFAERFVDPELDRFRRAGRSLMNDASDSDWSEEEEDGGEEEEEFFDSEEDEAESSSSSVIDPLIG